MFKIEFNPTNAFASSVLRQTKTCRNTLEKAFSDRHRSRWGAYVFQVADPDPNLVLAAHEALGPLAPEVVASLRGPMPVSLHVKNGRVVVRVDDQDETLVEELAPALHRILKTASLGRGTWSQTISTLPPATIKVCNRDYEYRLSSLELPVPSGTPNVALPWVADCIEKAILAARINIAMQQPDPYAAILALPSAPVTVQVTGGTLRNQQVSGGPCNYSSYSDVSFIANIQVEGEPSIGRSNPLGNGLLYSPHH